VVRAQAAIVGASPVHLGVERERHLGRLDVDLASPPPILGIRCDEHLARSVLGAPLVEPHLAVANRVLGFDAPMAVLAERYRLVVVEVGADPRHDQILAGARSRRSRFAAKYAAPSNA